MKVMSVACTVVGASALAGCSLLYNPNNLPSPNDAAVDAHVVVPDALVLTGVGPLVLLEGQGTGGSRPAILAITGSDIAKDATVALLPVDAQGPAPMIEVDNAHAVHALGGTVLAVPVTLPIDTNRGTPNQIEVMLTVQLTQMGTNGSPVVVLLEGKLKLRNLPELATAITDVAVLAMQYSHVDVSTGLSFDARANASPVVIRAVGAIDFGPGEVHADASGQTPGPGGGVGGVSGGTPGAGGGLGGGRAVVPLSSSASGGGYGKAGSDGAPVTGLMTPNPGGAMSGDDLITSYTTNGSGGGGGGGAVGGGGGGTIELTAGGTLTVGKLSANGAGASSNAGGGSGGAIVLRSGATATFGAITVSGGAGGGTGGGGGAVGRVRYDVPSLVGMAPSGSRRGVAFDTSAGSNPETSTEINPLVTNKEHQLIRVLGAASSTQFKVFVLGPTGNTTTSTTVMFGSSSADITPTLAVGYNHVCVTPPAGNPTLLESTNCLDIAYVP